MSIQKKKADRAKRRAFRVRGKFQSKGLMPRVSIFRSINQIYAQIIDDANHKTLVDFSSIKLADKSGDKKEVAKKVGLELSKLALEKGIKQVYFDRGRFLYHGRVQSLADGLRDGGLTF